MCAEQAEYSAGLGVWFSVAHASGILSENRSRPRQVVKAELWIKIMEIVKGNRPKSRDWRGFPVFRL
jgi:hypothetical protein